MSTFEAGSRVGRYRIVRPLGSGAMGDVYLAEDPQIERRLAIKTVRLEGVRESEIEDRKQRLLREARAAGRLLHPHIVTLFDAGEEDGTLYLAFEYIEGRDLDRRLEEGPPPSLREVLVIVRQVAEGLDYAHQQGVVHRDIKPGNILMDERGWVKVGDFGIAKMLGQSTELTMTGAVVGSPYYLSPEQIRGEPLDGRSDIFSLGVVLYELLTSRRPFQGESLSTLVYKILHENPPAISQLRPDLAPRVESLVTTMLAKDRGERQQSAAAVVEEVRALEGALPAAVLDAPAARRAEGLEPTVASTSMAPPPPPLPPASSAAVSPPPPSYGAAARPGRRRGPWLGLAAVAAVAAVLLVVLLWSRLGMPLANEGGRVSEVSEMGGSTEEPAAAGGDHDLERTPAAGAAVGEGEEEMERAEASRRAESPVAREEAVRAPQRQETMAAPPAAQPRPPRESPPPPPARPRPSPPPATSSSPAPVASEQGPVEEEEADERQEVAVKTPEPAPEEPPEPEVETIAEPVDQTLDTGLDLAFRVQPADAFVLLDGTVIGRAEEYAGGPSGGYRLPGPGEYLIKIRKPGMYDYRVRVRASRDRPGASLVVARLERQPGGEMDLADLERYRAREGVVLRVLPRDARVLVDDRFVGPAARFSGGLRGGFLRLDRGIHRLSLVAPGHQRVDLAVDVNDGAPQAREKITLRLPPL